MLHELIQELLKLKHDNTFITNLCSTLIIVTILTLGSEYLHNSPSRLGNQGRITQFSQTVSAGMVIKTYKYFYR
ncbi:MAG: hypothetical protein ACFCU5_17565 [Pleurocapsa sp.]